MSARRRRGYATLARLQGDSDGRVSAAEPEPLARGAEAGRIMAALFPDRLTVAELMNNTG